jgi:predicted RNase H-like HicB family nuclease
MDMMREEEYDVVLTRQSEGGYTVTVPELPEVTTEGDTLEEALEMVRDAIAGYLETVRELGWTARRGEHQRVTVRLA